jgi:hypothetical protein
MKVRAIDHTSNVSAGDMFVPRYCSFVVPSDFPAGQRHLRVSFANCRVAMATFVSYVPITASGGSRGSLAEAGWTLKEHAR